MCQLWGYLLKDTATCSPDRAMVTSGDTWDRSGKGSATPPALNYSSLEDDLRTTVLGGVPVTGD